MRSADAESATSQLQKCCYEGGHLSDSRTFPNDFLTMTHRSNQFLLVKGFLRVEPDILYKNPSNNWPSDRLQHSLTSVSQFFSLLLYSNIYAMSSIDQLNDSSDSDASFDSGYSSICLTRSPPPVIFDRRFFLFIPVEAATLLPVPFKPAARVTPIKQRQRPIRFERRLVKWSLPPPPARAALLPGWNPMPL